MKTIAVLTGLGRTMAIDHYHLQYFLLFDSSGLSAQGDDELPPSMRSSTAVSVDLPRSFITSDTISLTSRALADT